MTILSFCVRVLGVNFLSIEDREITIFVLFDGYFPTASSIASSCSEAGFSGMSKMNTNLPIDRYVAVNKYTYLFTATTTSWALKV